MSGDPTDSGGAAVDRGPAPRRDPLPASPGAPPPGTPTLERVLGFAGLPLLAVALLAATRWPALLDLRAYLGAAREVAAGRSAYGPTLAAGPEGWGTQLVYVSPPFVAQVLAPFSALPLEVVGAGWIAAGTIALLAATRLVDRRHLVARAPLAAFVLGTIPGSAVIGQVNLLALAGLLLALGARSDRTAGLGLALAIAVRGTPAAFAVVLLLERRTRALAWAAGALGALVLLDPGAWLTFLEVARRAAAIPTLVEASVQTSLAATPALHALAALLVAVVLATTLVVPHERALRAGLAVGLALVLLPANAWHHWLSFALAPLLLRGDERPWSRRVYLAFLAASLVTVGPLSSAVALATLATLATLGLRDALGRSGGRGGPEPAAILPGP